MKLHYSVFLFCVASQCTSPCCCNEYSLWLFYHYGLAVLHCTVYNEWTGDLSIGPFTNDRRRTNKQLTLNHLLSCAQLMRSWCAYFSAMQMHSENVCDKTTKSVCWTIFESVARNGPSGSINGHTRLVVYCFMQTTFRHQFMNIEWTIDVLWMRCIRIFCVRPGKFDFNRTSEYILSKNVLKFYGKFVFYQCYREKLSDKNWRLRIWVSW